MKRFLTVILVVCILLTVSLCSCDKENKSGGNVSLTTAEGTKLSVPKQLSETWQSNTGRTTIEVTANVEFPNVNAVPIIEVAAPDFTEAQIYKFAETVFGGMPYHEIKSDGKEEQSHKYMNFDSDETYSNAYHNKEFPIYSVSAMLNLGTEAKYYRSHPDENISFNMFGEVFSKTDSSEYAEALSKAENYVKAFSPGMKCVGTEISRGVSDNNLNADNGGSKTDKYAYVFHFTCPYADIPTTYTSTDCISSDDSYKVSRRYESVDIMISEYGLESVEWHAPYKTIGTLNKNTPLLSFEKIIDVAKTMIPLKFANFERDGMTNSMLINRITFGYTRVQMKDDPNRYIMVPAWDFFGMEAGWKTTENTVIPFESLITINAVDGTVIDRSYGY